MLEQVVSILTSNKIAVLEHAAAKNKAETTSIGTAEAETVDDEPNKCSLPHDDNLNTNVLLVEAEGAMADLQIASAAQAETATNSGRGEQGRAEAEELSDADLLLDLKLRVKWLKAVCEFDKFELTARFASNELLSDAVALMTAQNCAKNEAAVAKYQAGLK